MKFRCCYATPTIKFSLAVCALFSVLLLLQHVLSPALPKCEPTPGASPLDYRTPPDDNQTFAFARTLTARDISRFRAKNVTCARLFANDELEHERARYVQSFARRAVPARKYEEAARDCVRFRRRRRYAAYPGSKEEARFPLAFSIVIYRDIDQFERLLQVLYRPQNTYCIHVDRKAPADFRAAAKAIVGCFDNVFLASRSLPVHWGTYSVLEADLWCMEDLWRRSARWKYFINLTGQEWPLRTHAELVKVLMTYNGSNNIEGTVLRMSTGVRARIGDPPCGVRLTKGSTHIVASRAFVHYALHSPVARALRAWLRTITFPDEMYFSSLNHSPHLGVPGAYTGIPETDTTTYRFLTRYKNWGTAPFNYPCPGRHWVRQICLLSLGDLPRLAARPELFANKFVRDFHPLALDCMEELIHNRTRAELMDGGGGLGEGGRNGGVTARGAKEARERVGTAFDVEFYRGQDFVRNHV